MEKLVGNFAGSRGVSVPIHWSIINAKTGNIFSSGEIESQGAKVWGGDKTSRKVADLPDFKFGKYILRAEILRPVPEFKNINTQVVIRWGVYDGL